MDGYPMPIADMLVDAAAGHMVISFMDGNAGIDCLVDLLSYRLSEPHIRDCLTTPARSVLNY